MRQHVSLEHRRPEPVGGPARVRAGSGTSSPEARTSRPYRTLLVEDDTINRMAVGKLLESLGCEVQTAEHGRSALQRITATERAFDIIFMDIQMPVMDGLETTRRIRGLPSPLSATPIVAMTAYAMHGDRERFLAAGMDEYISKPVEREELEDVLHRLVPSVPGT